MQLGAVVCSLTGLAPPALDMIVRHVRPAIARRGRSWALPLEQRVIIACTSLRTNLTVRELAAVFGISPSQAHRIVTDLIPRIAALPRATPDVDRRHAWVVDGTLVPTRDHSAAAKAKNYRWSCNAQVLIRRRDLHVIAVAAGGPGNRNGPIHYRGSEVERLCRVHGRVLADAGYRGVPEPSPPPWPANDSRPAVAQSSTTPCTRRTRACSAQGLARLARLPPARRTPTSITASDRCPAQHQDRITKQLLVIDASTCRDVQHVAIQPRSCDRCLRAHNSLARRVRSRAGSLVASRSSVSL